MEKLDASGAKVIDWDSMDDNASDADGGMDVDDFEVDFSDSQASIVDKHTPTQRVEMTDEMSLRIEDLSKSGLTSSDMSTGGLDPQIKGSANVPNKVKGYTIHYFNIWGKRIPYYRLRLFDHEPKYKQPKNNPNHVYFPQNFMGIFKKLGSKLIIITEGEKKAALLCKHGFPAIAFSGVDSWRNKFISIPQEYTRIENGPKGMLTFKMSDKPLDENVFKGTAEGFEDFVNLLYKSRAQLVMCYDSEAPETKSFTNVQRAAAGLGFELRNRGVGVTNIRQMLLPQLNPGEKIGVDDFIVHPEGGLAKFKDLLAATLAKDNAFPMFPNIREYISKSLGKPRLGRKQYQQIGIALMSDLDRRGKRMFNPNEEQLYYFNRDNKHLMKVRINEDLGGAINGTEFGRLLYKDYDISPTADQTIMRWLGTQISAEQPIEDVIPSRIIARPRADEDAVRFQLNDGQFVKVTGDAKKPFQIHNNGDDNTLFVSEGTLPIDGDELAKCLTHVSKQKLEPWWFDVFKEVKLKEEGRSATIMALLYYISPWLYRWRGTQLPIEMVCGESGSGKSTLVSLRLNILTGQASLKNAPSDLKDWYATLSKTGGMHVTDNLHFTDKQLAQRMSDELCRLVTEPNPTIEQRKLFTNTDVLRVPVDAIFSFTAIKQPFNNADLIQRSFILELDKVKALAHTDNEDAEPMEVKEYAFDSYWMQHQIERFGGRSMWVAHHLWALHKFFQLVDKKWDKQYKAKYRLINMEQALMLMAEVFGVDASWIPEHLSATTNKIIGQSDWVLEGLLAFNKHWVSRHGYGKTFTAGDIVSFASASEEYEDNNMLTNARTLGRYMQVAKYNIATIAGIIEAKAVANKKHYQIVKPKGQAAIPTLPQ